MGCWQAAFDQQPTPIVILSEKSHIVATNRACQQIFDDYNELVNKRVDELPISWQDGDKSTLEDLLARNVEKWCTELGRKQQDSAWALMRLAVEIKNDGQTAFTASLLVSDFQLDNNTYRMLSFENVKESSSLPFLQRRSSTQVHFDEGGEKSLHTPTDKEAVSRSGARTASGKEATELKFSQLCDAIYHNSTSNGFLLAADETFCYPNYTASKSVAPVEIDDIELFFASWQLYDPQFKRRVEFEELPSIWLSRQRTKFRNLRYGLREDGKDLIIECSGDPLYDSKTGEYLGCVVWVTTLGEYADVLANELKHSLSDFKNICDRLPHLLWTIDPSGNADYFSQSWYDFTGLTEQQSLGLGFVDALDPEAMPGLWESFYQVAETRTEVVKEAKYRRHDGQWRWMNLRAKPLTDSSGKVLKWYGTSTDVHNLVMERLIAEQKKDEMRHMLSLTDIGLFEVEDGELNVLEGRLAWVRGSTTIPLAEIEKDSDPGALSVAMHLREILRDSNRSVSFEIQIRSRWYKFRLVHEKDSGGEKESKKVFGCSVDVTEQRGRAALEAENARLVHEATLEMEKSRLKTAFLAHMSHEIRTPIAGIIGTADMLADTTLDDEQSEGLKNIEMSAQNLLTIVNDILDLSKIEAGQMQFEKVSFDMHEVISQITKLFLPTARSKFLTLSYENDTSQQLEVIADPGRVRQILTNLVSNAIKFTAKGSVALSVEIVGNDIRCIVQDTGEGIDVATMQMLFKPFVQGDASTARRHGGTGLGLTISRNLAQMMGGTLILESYALQGTKAILTLPRDVTIRSTPTSEPAAKPPLPFPAPVTVTRTFSSPANIDLKNSHHPIQVQTTSEPLVLIVEDNAINQKVAINLVRKLGYATHAVWNGQEALDYLGTSVSPPSNLPTVSDGSDTPIPQQPPRPSLVLMDCQMPILDGYQCTRQLRTDPQYWAFKTVPVIALTASAIQGDQERCKAAGMDDYLSKPVNKNLLRSMLKKWIPEGPA